MSLAHTRRVGVLAAIGLVGASLALAASLAAEPAMAAKKQKFTEDFQIEECGGFTNSGDSNPYFSLVPNYQLVLEGKDGKTTVELTVLVTEDTKTVDLGPPVGTIVTRVVDEIEKEDGELVEISHNFFAICNRTGDAMYFGEEVDFYENGVIVDHEGSWEAGKNGARPGIIMPGTVLLGARYQQEIAPDVAMDRAEILSLSETVETPAGTFEDVLKVRETNPLDRDKEFKYHVAGIGLIQDEKLKLISHGMATRPRQSRGR
jgi:hypothetical protein